MSKFDYPFCEICAEDKHIFVDAVKYSRGLEVCYSCFEETGI